MINTDFDGKFQALMKQMIMVVIYLAINSEERVDGLPNLT